MFFWLLTNRMTPPAVFLLPFFQLYTTVGLMDTHIAVALAHLLFNVPLAVWILEGFMSGIPREIDETAYIDGYSFPRFFLTIFLPLIKAGVGGVAGVLLLHVQLGGAAAGAHAHQRERQAHRRDDDAHGVAPRAWTGATLAAAGVLTIVPVPSSSGLCATTSQGFCDGPFDQRSRHVRVDGLDHAGGRFLHLHRVHAHRHDGVEIKVPPTERAGFLPIATTRGDRLSSGCSARPTSTCCSGGSGRKKMMQWFSLGAEPSVWISFVLSMLAAGADHAGLNAFSRITGPMFFGRGFMVVKGSPNQETRMPKCN